VIKSLVDGARGAGRWRRAAVSGSGLDRTGAAVSSMEFGERAAGGGRRGRVRDWVVWRLMQRPPAASSLDGEILNNDAETEVLLSLGEGVFVAALRASGGGCRVRPHGAGGGSREANVGVYARHTSPVTCRRSHL
jgi:hypothetical protein